MKRGLFILFATLNLSAAESPSVDYHPPRPLADDALWSEWPRFFGPSDNNITTETHLLEKFPEEGLSNYR